MTRSKRRSRPPLMAIGVAAATLVADVCSSHREDRMAMTSDTMVGESHSSFRHLFEDELCTLVWRLRDNALLQRSAQALVERIQQRLYVDDDAHTLVLIGDHEAAAWLAARLLKKYQFFLYELTEDGVPDVTAPSPNGVDALRYVRKRMRKGKFTLVS